MKRLDLRILSLLLLGSGLASSARAQVLVGKHDGDQPGMALGSALAGVGDLDGDGRGDVVVGAPLYDDLSAGKADGGLFHWDSGVPFGPASASWPQLKPLSSSWLSANGTQFGVALSSAGDIDLDGVPDIAVGAQGTLAVAGFVAVYSGKFVQGGPFLSYSFSPGLVGAEFGHALDSLGDVNADGYPDLAVGAPRADFSGIDAGRVYVLSGRLLVQSTPNPVLYTLDGATAGEWFGYSVAALGDVDQDGKGDFAIGAPKANAGGGRVTFHGGATGGMFSFPATGAAGDRMGWSVSPAGDYDGDGWLDVLAGSPGDDTALGADVGSAVVLSGKFMVLHQGSGTLQLFPGQAAGEQQGCSVCRLGDLNGDGRPELAIGAPTPTGIGKVRVYAGASGTLLAERTGQADSLYGNAVAAGGDSNGDGRPELLVGAPLHDGMGRMELLAFCPIGDVLYCLGKTNSLGCDPRIDTNGQSSASSSVPHLIRATNIINNKNGILFYGFGEAALPFMGGTLCVSGQVTRTPGQFSGGSATGNDCTGTFFFDFNAWIQGGNDPLLKPGVEVYAQYWYRDPPSSFGSGLSNAARFTICP